MKEIILYDIPGKTQEGKAWSCNTWNARFALNLKGLKYKTEWVEYPDIEALCKQLGAPASGLKSDGVTPHYTLPVIQDPNTGKVIADSSAVAKYLDATYSTSGPRLFPDGTGVLQSAFSDAFVSACFWVLYPVVILATCKHLNPRSYEYFRRTREETMGKLEEVVPEGTEKGETKWKELEEGMTKVAKWFEAGGDKPFVGGDLPIYADIQVAGMLIWAKNVLGKDSKEWGRISAMNGGRWGEFLKDWEQWSQIM
ncbi:hypothetical protein EIP91_006228 [Steccherinum ochraceum]|uniref:GST N-terminal domain-containing protein n=1 Tax=Steccherinum ochraceum TaxID=92696 RepID=A0A4R0R5Z6_9APHY|nr:hypothetical protein EIP91_006228 [Steccherinum ochraceum]